jgi:ankyrin repeat protein
MTSSSKKYPLHHLIEYERCDLLKHVKDLIAKGHSIHECDDYDRTPLLIALNYGQDDVAEHLISLGADVNVVRTGWTALHYAACSKRSRLAKTIIEHPKYTHSVNAVTLKGETPLTYAIACKSPECVELLIKSGADVTLADNYGCTPLFIALRERNVQIIELLLKAGARINLLETHGLYDLKGLSPDNPKKMQIYSLLKQYECEC